MFVAVEHGEYKFMVIDPEHDVLQSIMSIRPVSRDDLCGTPLLTLFKIYHNARLQTHRRRWRTSNVARRSSTLPSRSWHRARFVPGQAQVGVF